MPARSSGRSSPDDRPRPGRLRHRDPRRRLFVIYVPATTLFAWRIGRVVEHRTVERQKNDGAWRGELATMLNRVGLIAASRGESAQLSTNSRLYGGIDHAWRRQNVWVATMMMFTDVSTFLSQRLLAYLPALPRLHLGRHELPHLRRELRADRRADRRRLLVHQRDAEIAICRANAAPPDRARRRHRAGARPRPLLRRDRHQQLPAPRDRRRADAGDRRSRALPPRPRRASLRHRAAARRCVPATGCTSAGRAAAARARSSRRSPASGRTATAGSASPPARGCSSPRRRRTSPSG